MGAFVLEIVFKIVNVNIAVAKRLSRGEVEVSDHFVNPDAAINTAAFLALSVQSFSVMFAGALLHVLSASKRPGDCGIRISDFITGVATSFLLARFWRRGAI